jgi:hypothetical protein
MAPHDCSRVVLADFGYALRQSDVDVVSRNPDWPYDEEIPVIEASCEAPESPFANAAVDVYEIGELMLKFILVECFPAMDSPSLSTQASCASWCTSVGSMSLTEYLRSP